MRLLGRCGVYEMGKFFRCSSFCHLTVRRIDSVGCGDIAAVVLPRVQDPCFPRGRVGVPTASLEPYRSRNIDWDAMTISPHISCFRVVSAAQEHDKPIKRHGSCNVPTDWSDFSDNTRGPPAGTEVASVGVAEIYGFEIEVGH